MKLTLNLDKMTSLAWCLMLAYTAFLVPSDVLAQTIGYNGGGDGGQIGEVLCNVAAWFTGPIGQGIATLAILVIGVGALMGKVSWGMAIIVGIGIAVIFGAPAIVDDLGVGEGCMNY